MKKINPIPVKLRLKELFIDYLVIWAYLVGLFVVMMVIYFVFLDGIPTFTQTDSQLMATFSSVIPIILIFTWMDYKGGSLGKRKTGLKLTYVDHSFLNSLIRNVIKFIPWQLAHIGVIRGMFTEFDWIYNLFVFVSLFLLGLMLSMGLRSEDKRHLGDYLAKTQVVQ